MDNLKTDTLADAAVALARLAGLDLTDPQRDFLVSMFAVREDGKWASSIAEVMLGRDTEAVLMARALAGLLLLDERVVWSTYRPITYRCNFSHFVGLLHRVCEADPSVADLKAFGNNGQERVERLSTGAQVRFTTHQRDQRGWTCDMVIVQESEHWTDQQRSQVLPCLASVSNSQLVLA